MTPVAQYQSILDDEEDFFAPIKREKKPKVNLDELKQLWDERKEEQIAGQKAGEALIQKELGVSYKELLKKQAKQKKSVPIFLEEADKSKSVGNEQSNQVQQEDEDDSYCEEPFLEVVVPKVAPNTGVQNESDVRNLMNGVLFIKCKIQGQCSKQLAVMLIDLSIQIKHGFIVAQNALELYILLLTNKSSAGFLGQEIEYVHEFVPDATYFLELFQELGQYDGSFERGESALLGQH
eukprot:TRINITY_DN17979_c1_g1_i1.p1 TRINITY_DN17979_c1_g1~~TRINITY_DN17979_c1_g1_i1.p1  ORF type:complete len:236 (-),score=38.26 TRINITY_DN17979_c1_g1_i1:37-744(-)